MEGRQIYVALFDDVEHVPEALDLLRQKGISDEEIQIQSGVPYASSILGRPSIAPRVPKYGLVGAVLGFLAAAFVTHGTAWLYPLRVGGFPLFSMPPSYIPFFEFTMLGLLVFSFVGVFLEGLLPPVKVKRVYHPAVSDSAVAIFFACDTQRAAELHQELIQQGAAKVEPAEGEFL